MARGATDSILPHPAVFLATYAVTAAAWSAAWALGPPATGPSPCRPSRWASRSAAASPAT